MTDTSGGGKEGEDPSVAPSTISRFACRVVCERNPPYTARIYAAGFDSSKNIFLGVSGPTQCVQLIKFIGGEDNRKAISQRHLKQNAEKAFR